MGDIIEYNGYVGEIDEYNTEASDERIVYIYTKEGYKVGEYLEQISLKEDNIVEYIEEYIRENYFRVCTECGKEMNKGYCIADGLEYYCSDECLHKHYTQQEFNEMYDNGNGDSYWTEWEEEKNG